MNSDAGSEPQEFEAKTVARAVATRTKLLSQIRQKNFGSFFEGKFWGYLSCYALLTLCGYWLLRSLKQLDLFLPILFLAMGVSLLNNLKTDSTHRRLNALVQLLEDSGVIKT